MTTCPKCDQPHNPTLCNGHNNRGEQCGKTPIKGATVCRTHGGSAPQVRAAAEQRQLAAAADEALKASLWPGLTNATPVKDPVASLERLAGALEQLVDQAGDRVTKLQHVAGGKDLTQLRAEVTLLERALGHLRGVLVDMARLGIAERHVQLEQERAALVVAAFMAAVEVAGLLPADRDLVVRTFLDRLGDVVPGEVLA